MRRRRRRKKNKVKIDAKIRDGPLSLMLPRHLSFAPNNVAESEDMRKAFFHGRKKQPRDYVTYPNCFSRALQCSPPLRHMQNGMQSEDREEGGGRVWKERRKTLLLLSLICNGLAFLKDYLHHHPLSLFLSHGRERRDGGGKERGRKKASSSRHSLFFFITPFLPS